jgi:hypothetical protein
LPILWAVAVVLAVKSYFLQKENLDYGILYTLALASSAAFLAAGIGMWTYSFINRRSQDREFNRAIEIRYFEEIYGPLYEELALVRDDLKSNGWPTLTQWPRIAKSRFGPVIDGTISNLFIALSYRLEDYSRRSQPSFDAATRCIQLVIAGNADLNPLSEQGRTDIALAVEADRPFTFDDSVTTLQDHIFNRLETSLKSAIPGFKKADGEDFLKRLKPVLRTDPIIAEHAKMRESLIESTTQLAALVLDRMKPFHET